MYVEDADADGPESDASSAASSPEAGKLGSGGA